MGHAVLGMLHMLSLSMLLLQATQSDARWLQAQVCLHRHSLSRSS